MKYLRQILEVWSWNCFDIWMQEGLINRNSSSKLRRHWWGIDATKWRLQWTSYGGIVSWQSSCDGVLVRLVEPLRLSGWWLTYPFWKIWVRQWEGLSHILWKIKNVWNHQPAMNAVLVSYWVKFFFSRFLLMTFFNILHLLASYWWRSSTYCISWQKPLLWSLDETYSLGTAECGHQRQKKTMHETDSTMSP